MAEASTTSPKDVDQSRLSEAEIAVHWKEEELHYPSPRFIGQANLTDPAVNERFSEKNFPECYREYADLLSWDKYWTTTLDTSKAPFWKWFVGGKINASYNCVDRNLEKYPEQSCDPLCLGGGGRADRGDHVPRALYPGQRDGGPPARLLRAQDRGPGHDPHADGGAASGYHAGMRPVG